MHFWWPKGSTTPSGEALSPVGCSNCFLTLERRGTICWGGSSMHCSSCGRRHIKWSQVQDSCSWSIRFQWDSEIFIIVSCVLLCFVSVSMNLKLLNHVILWGIFFTTRVSHCTKCLPICCAPQYLHASSCSHPQ